MCFFLAVIRAVTKDAGWAVEYVVVMNCACIRFLKKIMNVFEK
jgi:hypothetical protein